ncbi:cytochrome P450 [Collybia nuda]|uniref:Cytochrome P450 n=1 Tax=Collybia nuda TaxID=64659 RepID=A0A9P5XVP4_9AGAR|nr:cytochrome P450 [Collybia nuda]
MLTLLAGVLVALWITRSYLFAPARRGLPPGPRKFPVIGNLLSFPRSRPHLQFTKWAREYGSIFSLKIMKLNIIVLSSPSIIREVIDKRGASSANRPESVIADIIAPNSMNIGAATYPNDTWKTMRRAAVAMLSAKNIEKFKPVQRAEAAQLMWDMLRNPENFYDDICRYTTSVFLAIIYGHRAPQASTQEAEMFTKVQMDFMQIVEMGKSPPVDIFPILRLVPPRFAPWKSKALDIRSRHESLFGHLLSLVKNRVSSGQENGAFMEEAYLRQMEWGLSDTMLLNLGGTLLEGSDTSSAILQTIVMLLAAYPEAQTKAQEEIDSKVGDQNPPTWTDLQGLHYMNAFIEESIRFRPVDPLGIPHSMSNDEWVGDTLIPMGSIIFMNIWAVYHDEHYFAEPEKFQPERFLTHPLGIRPDIEDDPGRRENLIFGGGRRICPGTALAKAGIAINVAHFLWAFNFTPAKDPITGGSCPPDLWAFTEGVNATPLPFRCTIRPRSTEKAEIIRRHYVDQASVLEPFEQDISAQDRAFIASTRTRS